jgi:hypothetical protein
MEMRNAHILIRKSKDKEPSGKPRQRWDDNIKTMLHRVGWFVHSNEPENSDLIKSAVFWDDDVSCYTLKMQAEGSSTTLVPT